MFTGIIEEIGTVERIEEAGPAAQRQQAEHDRQQRQHGWQREHCDELLEPEEEGVGGEFHLRAGRGLAAAAAAKYYRRIPPSLP